MSSRGCLKRMWCSCGCENGTQVCIPAWVLNVFLLGGHWAQKFGCVAVSAESGVCKPHVSIVQIFLKNKIVEFAPIVPLKTAILQFDIQRTYWAAVVEKSSLSDKPESVLKGQESGAKSSCQLAAPCFKGQCKWAFNNSSVTGWNLLCWLAYSIWLYVPAAG